MIRIDGGQKSGSGTVVRYATSLCALLGEELILNNIRAKRDKPGLRPQHLKAITALAEVCGGAVDGAEVGSRQIRFKPGKGVAARYYQWDIGTAGSTTMLAMTVLPLVCFAQDTVSLRICGGLFQDFAPSAYHMQRVLLPILGKMGIEAQLDIIRPGYVPRGGGIIEVTVRPMMANRARPLKLTAQGKVVKVEGVSLCSHLKERKVSERMVRAFTDALKAKWHREYTVHIETIYDDTALQAGAALAVYATTSSGCIIGTDRAGKPRRSAEEIGKYVAKALLQDLESGASVDRYLADQIILYAALGDGITEYKIPEITEHIETNLWLVEEIVGAKTEVRGNILKIHGAGFHRD